MQNRIAKYFKLLFVIIFLIGSSKVSAINKAPGYLGMKAIVYYNPLLFPSWINPNQNNKRTFISVNYKHNLEFEYIMTRTYSFGATFKYYSTFTDPENFVKITKEVVDTSSGWTNYYTSTFQLDTALHLGAMHFGLFYKTYATNNSLAPLGSYFKLSFEMINSWLKNKSPETTTASDNDNNKLALRDNGAITKYLISMKFGKQNIYYDRMILNVGFQFGWVLKNYGLKNLTRSIEPTENDYLEILTSTRIWHHNFMNLSFGIGVLLF